MNSRRSRQVLITVSIHQGKYCVGKKMFNYLLMRRFILSFLEIDPSGPKFRFYATLTPISRRQPIFCIHYIDLTFTVSKPCQMPPSDIVALSSLNPPQPSPHTHTHTQCETQTHPLTREQPVLSRTPLKDETVFSHQAGGRRRRTASLRKRRWRAECRLE